MSDAQYMQRCLDLARSGAGYVAPNPMVGSVIVHDERIIGEGYHEQYGEAHAEVNAINAVKDASQLSHSTLYVNLEPCAHYGKTPPCADLIVQSGIKKVFIGCQDSYAKVNGQGIDKLKAAGIEVNVGLLEKESVDLNKWFFTFHEKKRPYIILKWAETVDGFVDATRTSKDPSLKITCEASNVLVHKWRAEESAIMVAKNTAIRDNPSLNTRKYNGPNPTRILLDANLEIPTAHKLFDKQCKILVINHIKDSSEVNIEYIKIPNVHDMKSVLNILYERNIQSVLVEGGPTLHRSFYDAGLWDEIRKFVSPNAINGGIEAMPLKLDADEQMKIGTDSLYIYRSR